MSNTVGIGVIGLGFMGRTHVAAWNAAAADGLGCKLVAVCDQDEERRSGKGTVAGNIDAGGESERLFDPDEVAGYADALDLLADDDVAAVSICTHTETHARLAIRALEAGKHVLVEKPLSLDSDAADRVSAAAHAAYTRCMPAMCMRFWPGWDWLRENIVKETWGRVKGATFHRLGSHPAWSKNFYSDPTRTGGALFDLHIHDADFVRWCFGDPVSVSSMGTVDHVTTSYRFASGPDYVIAEGGWDHAPGWDFRMRYVVNFENATADFDLTRERQLLLSKDGEQEAVELPDANGYDGEIRHFLEAIHDGEVPLRATVAEAAAVTRLLEAEKRSIDTGDPFRL